MSDKKIEIAFVESELEALQKNPDVLRSLADYHEVRIAEADSLDMPDCVKFHEARRDELLTAAAKLSEDL